MPYVYTVDQEHRRIEVRFSGEVSLDERRQASREVLARAARYGIRRVLLDYRRANSLSSQHEASAELAESIARHPIGPATRLAYLVTHDHQLDPTVERLAAARGVPCERFVDPAAAVAWLEEVAGPVPVAGEPGSNWATWVD